MDLSRRPAALLWAAIALNTIATLYTARVTLKNFPNSGDEYATVVSATLFAEGRLSAPSPPAPTFFDITHIINNGRYFGKYPPGWPMVLAPGVALGIAWLVNPVFGILTLLIVYRTALEHFSLRTARIALLLATLNPFLIFNSASYFSHPSCLVFIALAIFALLRVANGSVARRDLLLMGGAAGLAFLIRPFTAAVALAPAGLYLAVRLQRTDRWKTLVGRIRWALLPFLSCVLGFLIYNQCMTGDPYLQPFTLYDPRDALGFGGQFDDFPRRVMNTVVIRAFELNKWVPLSVVLLGLFFADPRLRVSSRPLLFCAVPLSLGLAYFFYWGHGGNQYGPRYLYESLTCLLLASAVVLARWGSVGKILVATVVLLNVTTFAWATSFYGRQVQERTDVYDRVAERGLSNAIVFLGTGSGTMFPCDLTRNGTRFDGPVLYVQDRGPANKELLAAFPKRMPYIYEFDAAAGRGSLRPCPNLTPRSP
jgi:hypothetical protein